MRGTSPAPLDLPPLTPLCLNLSQSLAGSSNVDFVRGSLTETGGEMGAMSGGGEGKDGWKDKQKSLTNITDAHTRSLIYINTHL